jgi:Holliday junction resolvasome RuvABC endonuclease subunit
MINRRVLSLDISTKTGWALMIIENNAIKLEKYGVIPQVQKPEGEYPGCFVDWAYLCFYGIVKIIEDCKADVLVIEETCANSKSSHSQKILEFSHFLVAKYIQENKIKSKYMLTGEWRGIMDCRMNQKEREKNKEVRDYKKKNKSSIAYDKNGKRTGIITKKHIGLRRVEELFGIKLKLKDNDISDAILLCNSYCNQVLSNKEGKIWQI